MPRVAAVDCGTNSIRLLVCDVEPATGRQVDLVRRMEVVRLGQGVDANGRLAPEALERTFAAVDDYAGVIRDLGAGAVRFVATSATRDAENAGDFVAGVEQRIGASPEVVSGDEEAALSFTGATRELAGTRSGPFCVVDIGGGSTEVVLGEAGDPSAGAAPQVLAARSVDVGCVRLTERHLTADPPTPAQVAAARADVAAALDAVEEVVPLGRIGTVVGLAGSVTTIAAETLGLERYLPEAIHGSEHDVADVEAACARLLGASRAERAARGFMHPGRVDVIGAGALVWAAVLDRLQRRAGVSRAVVSEHDILDGIAWSVA